MNWDWEKLQEKRQRQSRTPSPQNDGPENPFEGFKPGVLVSRFFRGGVPAGSILIILALLWLASGIFIVNPGEVGVITRFGQYDREVGNGPHYHLPFPVERAEVVVAEPLRTVVIGQSLESGRGVKGAGGKISIEESSMFTGDENIVHMRFNVQYNISNPRDFLFSVRDPELIVKIASEAAMREVVGRNQIDSILMAGRAEVQVQALQVLEGILEPYHMGVRIHTVQLLDVEPPPEVEKAFQDVFAAREDRQRIINHAEAYRNSIVPVATGTAQGMLNAAQAYSRQVVQSAEGESKRFTALVAEFVKAKDITRKRLYLEALETVLAAPTMQKIIFSKDVKGNVLPLLNLDSSRQDFARQGGELRTGADPAPSGSGRPQTAAKPARTAGVDR